MTIRPPSSRRAADASQAGAGGRGGGQAEPAAADGYGTAEQVQTQADTAHAKAENAVVDPTVAELQALQLQCTTTRDEGGSGPLTARR